MNKQTGILAILVLIGATMHVFAEDTQMKSTAGMDQHFVKKAAQGSMMEVQLGKVAQDKANSADVKTFASRMVTEHGKATEELKSLASKKNLNLPTELPADHKPMLAKVSRASGASFDREYMRTMVMHHAKDLAEFRKASEKLNDEELKSWVAGKIPKLEEHFAQAKSIATKLGVDVDAAAKEGEMEAEKSASQPTS